MLAELFGVTTDYLLHASEVDELAMKTTLLEKQQFGILNLQHKQQNRQVALVSSFIALLIFGAVYFIGHNYFQIWNTSIILSELFLITAITAGINYHHRLRAKNKHSNN